MDFLIRASLGVAFACVVLAANLWIVQWAIRLFRPANYVTHVNSFELIGKADSGSGHGRVLAYMLKARLANLEAQLNGIDHALRTAAPTAALVAGVQARVSNVQPVEIPVRVLEPVSLQLSVGGVEVGGLLSRILAGFQQANSLQVVIRYDQQRSQG